jgi:hypothetical protein
MVLGSIAASSWSEPAKVSRTAATTVLQSDSVAPVIQFTEDGQMLKPTGYRQWVYVGTPLTPNDMNDGSAPFPEFHSVYINPAAYKHYEQTGEFPDQTVLIKELVSVGTKKATSGKGYFMGDFIGLEVAMKDAKRFKDQPGNWAYFSFGHSYPLSDSANAQSAVNCSSCHGAAADQDYVFTQYYPVLRSAKPSAESK